MDKAQAQNQVIAQVRCLPIDLPVNRELCSSSNDLRSKLDPAFQAAYHCTSVFAVESVSP